MRDTIIRKQLHAFCRFATQNSDNYCRKESENESINGHELDQMAEKGALPKAMEI